MKKCLLTLLILAGFSPLTKAAAEESNRSTDEVNAVSEETNLIEPRYGLGFWCLARDRRGNTYRGYDRFMREARREALNQCWRSAWSYRDNWDRRDDRWDDRRDDPWDDRWNDRWDDHRDHRGYGRRGCWIVRCSQRHY